MTMKQLDFKHRFIPSSLQKPIEDSYNKNKKSKPLTLLLLHGTGGNEDDLIPLGQMICPSASLLSPRGKILENGMPRFFKRIAEGVFDIEDLKFRTKELANFVKDASNIYNFDLDNTIAIGFSNGANIATSLLLSYPETLLGAILFRSMVPFIPDNPIDLSDKKVLLSAGKFDPIASEKHAQDLFEILKKSRADVTVKWQQSGHNLIEKDITDSQNWISQNIY